MKKILLSLFVSFISLIGFGYCLTPDYTYNNVQNFYGINNQYPKNDSFLCFNSIDIQNYSFNEFAIRDNYNSDLLIVNGNGIKFIGGLRCAFIPSGTDYISISWQEPTWQLQSMNFYQFVLGANSCNGSTFSLNFIDNGLSTTNKSEFTLGEGDYTIYDIVYNSKDTPITINKSQANVSLASKYDNIECESHVSFSDISNGTGVKFLNSLFSPFSGANNVSVYYDSQDNVVQVDNQYGVAEVISAVPSTPPTPSDCSSCESDLSTCQSNLSSCGTSLSLCNNDLSACLSGNVGTGEYNWSALFINNIQHLGKPIINITIPEEINRDYTGNENSFDLDIKGYDIDSDYIQGIIDINSYTPTSEEFTETFVGGLTLIIPYIVLSLFILFVWKLLKKIFR